MLQLHTATLTPLPPLLASPRAIFFFFSRQNVWSRVQQPRIFLRQPRECVHALGTDSKDSAILYPDLKRWPWIFIRWPWQRSSEVTPREEYVGRGGGMFFFYFLNACWYFFCCCSLWFWGEWSYVAFFVSFCPGETDWLAGKKFLSPFFCMFKIFSTRQE